MSNWADSVDEIIDQASPHQAEAATAPSPSAVGSDEPEVHSSSSRFRGEPRKIPDHPPFQARLRNLVYSLTKEDIKDWFISVAHFDEEDILSTEVLMDKTGRASGVAIVEFKDRDALVKALSFDNYDVLDRPMHVMPNLPNRPRFSSERRDRYPDRREDRYSDRRDDRYSDRREDRYRGYDRHNDRGGYDRHNDHRSFGSSRSGYERRDRDEHRERQEPPKLNLQPRSAAPAASPSSSTSAKSDPFGGAKPVDTAKVEQEKLTAYKDKVKVKEAEKKPAADKHDSEKPPAAEHKPAAAAAASQEKQQTSSSSSSSASSPLSESSSPSDQKSPVRGSDFSSRGTRGRGDKRGGGRGAGRGAAASTERSWRDEGRPKAGRGEQKTRPAKTTTAKPSHTSTANKFASLDTSDE